MRFLMVLKIKITVSWDVTQGPLGVMDMNSMTLLLCNLVRRYKCFRGTRCLHLQDRRMS
jgi:hypothetical protein